MGNDRQAVFLSLFLRHETALRSYIRRLVARPSDADDVLQDVAAVLWEKFDQFEVGTHFDRWAFSVAYHRIRFHRQRLARERIQFSDDVFELLAVTEPAAEPAATDRQEALDQCVARLRTEERNLLARRFQPGGSNRELARQLGKSEATVSRALNRIYQNLLRCIAQHSSHAPA